MTKNSQNDREVRAQLEKLLKLRQRYRAAKEEVAALTKLGLIESKRLNQLIAGKSGR